MCEGDEATDRSFMNTTETIGPICGKSPVSESLIHFGTDYAPHGAFFCESGRTVVLLEMSRTGEVSRVCKLRSMDVRCILHQANRSHASTQMVELSITLQHRSPMKQC